MSEWRQYHSDIWAQGKPIMAGTASILINLVQMIALRIPLSLPVLSAVLFRILLAITVASLYWAAFSAWQVQYRRAEAHKRESDEMYSDMVLDWFKNATATPAMFPSRFVAEKMDLDEQKVVRGLETLVRLGVMRHDGEAVGWTYNPMAAMRFNCGLRRITSPRNSN